MKSLGNLQGASSSDSFNVPGIFMRFFRLFKNPEESLGNAGRHTPTPPHSGHQWIIRTPKNLEESCKHHSYSCSSFYSSSCSSLLRSPHPRSKVYLRPRSRKPTISDDGLFNVSATPQNPRVRIARESRKNPPEGSPHDVYLQKRPHTETIRNDRLFIGVTGGAPPPRYRRRRRHRRHSRPFIFIYYNLLQCIIFFLASLSSFLPSWYSLFTPTLLSSWINIRGS